MPERAKVVAVLFERHHLALFRFLARSLGSAAQAEDVVQDVFLRALRAIPDDPGLQERAWLFTTARNLVLNRRRDESRRGIPQELLERAGRAPSRSDAMDLHDALHRLDPLDRDLLLMRELGGLGYQELSLVTALTPDAVRSRLHRVRWSLRTALDPGRLSGVPSKGTEKRHE